MKSRINDIGKMILLERQNQETSQQLYILATYKRQGDLHLYAPNENGTKLRRVTAHSVLFQGGGKHKNVHQKFNLIPEIKEDISIILSHVNFKHVKEMVKLIYLGYSNFEKDEDLDQVCQLLQLFDFPLSEFYNDRIQENADIRRETETQLLTKSAEEPEQNSPLKRTTNFIVPLQPKKRKVIDETSYEKCESKRSAINLKLIETSADQNSNLTKDCF